MRNKPHYRIGQKVYYIKQTSKTLAEPTIRIEQQEIKSSVIYGIRQKAHIVLGNVVNIRTEYYLNPVIDIWTPEETLYPTFKAAKKALNQNDTQYTKLTIL